MKIKKNKKKLYILMFITQIIVNHIVAIDLADGFVGVFFIVHIDWFVNEAEITVYICRAGVQPEQDH